MEWQSIINNELAVGFKHSKLTDQLLDDISVAKTIEFSTNEDVNEVRRRAHTKQRLY